MLFKAIPDMSTYPLSPVIANEASKSIGLAAVVASKVLKIHF